MRKAAVKAAFLILIPFGREVYLELNRGEPKRHANEKENIRWMFFES